MQSELKPCDFCGTSDHLRVVTVGVMTGDMPERPHRVVCSHIDHDDVQGPVAYGRTQAIAAWNARASDAEITRLTEALRAAEERVKALREALAEISDLHGEINPCNYDNDDACELNRQFCYALTISSAALKDHPHADA